MRISLYTFLIFFVSGVFLSCKKDNYAQPQSELTGALMYQGDSINVQYDRVPFQLYQYGFGKVGPINGSFAQDGSLHALLFDGDYRFIIPVGQGPFLWKQTAAGTPDTLSIVVKGNQNIQIQVTPYYMIRNAQLSGGSGKVSATFKVEKIITDANAKNIEKVGLYINRTQFVSPSDKIASTELSGSAITDPNQINLSVSVPSMTPDQGYVFARVGVKIAGVEDMIFSSLRQVQYK